MAKEFGLDVREVLGWDACSPTLTHRQFLVLEAWLEMEWDHPDRGDHYLMLIACEVARVLSKNPNNIKARDFRLRFGIDPTANRDREQGSRGGSMGGPEAGRRTEASKGSWVGGLGEKVKRVTRYVGGMFGGTGEGSNSDGE